MCSGGVLVLCSLEGSVLGATGFPRGEVSSGSFARKVDELSKRVLRASREVNSLLASLRGRLLSCQEGLLRALREVKLFLAPLRGRLLKC